MRKRGKGLISLCLGVFLSLGVGVSLGGAHSEATEVKAAEEKNVEICVSINSTIGYSDNKTITLNAPNFDGGYDNITIAAKGVYRQAKADTYYQMNKKDGYLKNTIAMPGKITKIDATWNNDKGTTTCYFAENSEASSSYKTVTTAAAKSMTYTAPIDADYYYFNIDTSKGNGSAQLTSCKVYYEKVTKTVTSIDASLIDATKTYYVGDTLEPSDFKVTPSYDDGTSGNPIIDGTDVTLTNSTLTVEGDNVITISYFGVSTTVTIAAEPERILESISISDYVASFSQGDDFVFGGKVIAKYNVGDDVDVTSDATFSGYDLTSISTQTVTVSYGGKTASYEITVTKSMKITFDATSDKASSSGTASIEKDDVTIAITSGTLANGSEYRIYKSSNLTISTDMESQIKIVQIDLVCTAEDKKEYGPGNISLSSSSSGSYSYSSYNGTWENSNGVKKVILAASGSQIRIKKIIVTYMDYTFETEAKEYAQYFNEFIGCDPTGVNAPEGWSDLKDMWSDLSTGAQSVLKNVDTASETDSDILDCITTYDYIVGKYNSISPTTYNDFMGRGVVAASASNALYRTNDTNSAILAVVLVSFIGVTIIGGYLFIRKRRYN